MLIHGELAKIFGTIESQALLNTDIIHSGKQDVFLLRSAVNNSCCAYIRLFSCQSSAQELYRIVA